LEKLVGSSRLQWTIIPIALLVILLLGIVHAQTSGDCSAWTQVNDDAFGLNDPSGQSPPYQSEDSFELSVFDGQLYVGMEADDLYGARVWRTRAGVTIPSSQSDWEQVVVDAFGDVYNNDHIDSLQPFSSHLYASTAQKDADRDGTEVWRSSSGDAGTWTQVNDDGFGDPRNENFKDMIPFTAGSTVWLCGGTMNTDLGGQVWCTDGTLQGDGPKLNWVQKNLDGFGDAKYIKIWSTGVMDGHLYVGTQCLSSEACPGAVWRTDGTADGTRWQWARVFEATVNSRVDIVGVHDGYVYVGFFGNNGTEIWRSNSGAADTWSQVNNDGFGDAGNGRITVDAGTVYNDALYVATFNQATGAEVWRTANGTVWAQVNQDGFGNPNTMGAELMSFNGHLYAWAINYHTGQKVLRSKCPLCQSRDIAGTGSYSFDGVGATLDFAAENLDSVEICVYPDAFPTGQTEDKPIKRHYEIYSTPSDGAFTADVTLSYTVDEFSASDITDENTTYLTRWTGTGWQDCPQDQRARDTGHNTTTCGSVTDFSTWAIAGSYGLPPVTIFLPFVAHSSRRAILVAWETVAALQQIGFPLYRTDDVKNSKPDEPVTPRFRLDGTLLPL
jgi:hypothetical protein